MSAFRPRHLSVSAVALYAKCPALYRQRYVDRLVTPTNPPLQFGKAFHAALEAEHGGQDAERTLVHAWNIADNELAASGQVLHPGKAHALMLLDEYQRRGLGGKCGIPERKFVLPFPTPAIPVPLLGYIDLLLPTQRRFREFKTTSMTTWTATKIASEPQLHVYGWAYQRLFRHRPECAEYVIFGTVEPTMTVIEAVPSPDGFRLFELQAEATWRGIVAGDYDGCGVCKELCKPPVEREKVGPTVAWKE